VAQHAGEVGTALRYNDNSGAPFPNPAYPSYSSSLGTGAVEPPSPGRPVRVVIPTESPILWSAAALPSHFGTSHPSRSDAEQPVGEFDVARSPPSGAGGSNVAQHAGEVGTALRYNDNSGAPFPNPAYPSYSSSLGTGAVEPPSPGRPVRVVIPTESPILWSAAAGGGGLDVEYAGDSIQHSTSSAHDDGSGGVVVGSVLTDGANYVSEGLYNAASSTGSAVYDGEAYAISSIVSGAAYLQEGVAYVGSTVADSAAYTGSAVTDGVAYVGSTVADGAAYTGSAVADGASYVGRTVADGATYTGSAVADGASYTGSAIVNSGSVLASGAAYTGSAIAGGATYTASSLVSGVGYAGDGTYRVASAGATQAGEFYTYCQESMKDPSSRTLFFFIGLFALLLLLMPAVWNAMRLLHSSAFTHMLGRVVPVEIFVSSACVLWLYVAAALFYFAKARKEYQTEQRLMSFAVVFVLLVGGLFVTIFGQMNREVENAYRELMMVCQYGPRTHGLYSASEQLHDLRGSPECVNAVSIEHCPGYKATYETRVLKSLEQELACSGFCSVVPLAAAVGASSSASATASATTRSSPVQYPPSLFSSAASRGSCNGMAARSLRSFAGDIGNQFFFEGFVLCAVSVACGFLALAGAFLKDRRVTFLKDGAAPPYGAVVGRRARW